MGPRCHLCNEAERGRWHGWAHERWMWNWLGGYYREQMLDAHFLGIRCGLTK